MLRKLSVVAVAMLALPFTGCWEYDLFSWSPDGRYLVFVDPDEQQAWRWDTVKQRPAPLWGLDGADIASFRFSSDREAFVLGANFHTSGLFAPEVDGLAKLNVEDGGLHAVPPGSDVAGYAVSPDGRWVATIGGEGEDEDARLVVAVAPTDDVNKQRVLTEFKEDAFFPAFDRSGTRLLLTKAVPEEEVPEGAEEGMELVLLEFESDTVTTKTFARSFTELPIGPRFVSDDAFVYSRVREKDEEDGIAAIMLQTLDGGEPELLHEPAFGYFPPSLSPDGKTIVITATTSAPTDWNELMHSSVQLMTINLDTRKKAVITDEAFGAYAGKYHPTKNRIAYATGADPFCVRILDLDTGQDQLVWRDDEERLFVTAQRMLDTGDTGMAIANLDDLLHRFPETPFRSRAAYLRMNVHLDSPLNEFDDAVAAFEEIGNGDLRAQARPLLWNMVDVAAADPREDLIREYETDESKAEFEYDTDRTRDLTGLAVRATPDKIYLRVDFDSAYDLGGSVFADLILLFHRPGSDEGVRSITPNVEWEHPAVRTVIVRHWYPDGQVYDLEVLDEQGDAIARYAGSGFSPPSFPVFDAVDLGVKGSDNGGNVTCWIDLNAIGLRTDTEYYLQAVTAKGGIETYKGVERPRETDSWDIADAFGEANTKERIDTEIAAGEKPVLLGQAVTLRIPNESGR